MKYAQNFDEQRSFDKLIVGFIGKTLREKVGRENFDESVAICQIHQTFPPSNFCTMKYA